MSENKSLGKQANSLGELRAFFFGGGRSEQNSPGEQTKSLGEQGKRLVVSKQRILGQQDKRLVGSRGGLGGHQKVLVVNHRVKGSNGSVLGSNQRSNECGNTQRGYGSKSRVSRFSSESGERLCRASQNRLGLGVHPGHRGQTPLAAIRRHRPDKYEDPTGKQKSRLIYDGYKHDPSER